MAEQVQLEEKKKRIPRWGLIWLLLVIVYFAGVGPYVRYFRRNLFLEKGPVETTIIIAGGVLYAPLEWLLDVSPEPVDDAFR